MMLYRTFLTVSLFSLFFAATCHGYQEARFDNINGYAISLRWQQVQSGAIGSKAPPRPVMMELYGEVSNGKSCKQLNIEVYMMNTRDGSGISRLSTTVKDYNASYPSRLQAKDRVYGDENSKNYWKIDNIYTTCLN